jgi:succinyl-diaminopimelate desuccinylase
MPALRASPAELLRYTAAPVLAALTLPIMPLSTLSIAKALIARASVTPDDAGCQELLKGELAPLGFRFETIARNGVTNLWARRGDAAPLVCFAGHTDVVPTGPLDKWDSDPFVPTIRGDKLYGRGAADMKGSLAAFVTGIAAFLARHPDPRGSIALLLTSDEEGPAKDGTVAVIERLVARNEIPDYCIVGEPTSVQRAGDMVKNGRRGSLSAKLTVHGVQGHVAYPDQALNPVHAVAPAIAQLAGTVWDHGNDFFPPTTWQVSNVRAGTGAANVIPGEAEVLFNFRFSTASTPEGLQQRVRQVLQDSGVQFDLAWELGAKPFLTEPGALVDAVTEAVREAEGFMPELSTTGGTSDGRFLAEICPHVVELGPTNATIHKVNEYVPLADLERLPGLYRRVLERLLV